MPSSLISTQNRIESPFIIVTIGKYTFGQCGTKNSNGNLLNVDYPNYITSLSITKINGAVNMYTLVMTYAITQKDDPNMLEKVFSSVSKSRLIKLTYGDWNIPSYIYKEETAMITKISSDVDFKSATITYRLSCTSSALNLKAGSRDFKARYDRPSNVILELIDDKSTGLATIFGGMKSKEQVITANLIARDDKEVQLEAKTLNVLDYIAYLVSCMSSTSDSNSSGLNESVYYWAVYDDISNEYGGSYFKVVKATSNSTEALAYNTYEVDVGYPSGSYVTDFRITSNDTWSILYNYSEDVNLPQYSYTIDEQGNIVQSFSPKVTSSLEYGKTTESDKSWWTKMTQFPITAKLTIKGLLRPALLMTYVKVNAYFYGHKHVSSGIYIITKQEDSVSSDGYKTTLTLTRICGDSYV